MTTDPDCLLREQGQGRRFQLEWQLLLLGGLEREECVRDERPNRSVSLADWAGIYTPQPRAMTER